MTVKEFSMTIDSIYVIIYKWLNKNWKEYSSFCHRNMS